MSDENKPIITRRDFVRGTVGAAVAASVLGPDSVLRAATPRRAAPPRSRVVVVRDKAALDARHEVNAAALKAMLDRAVVGVTGKKTPRAAWQAIATPKDVVGLVPTDHLNPTHDEVIEAVTAALVDAGVPRDNVRNAQGRGHKYRACSVLIALPGLKAHWLTGIGTVIKNYIMFSGSPADYHRDKSTTLGEIWLRDGVKGKTRLVLVDALRPLCSKGPQPDPRYLWDYNGLIAGTDPVAVESVCLKILLAKREALRGEPWPLSPPPLCVAAADQTYHLGTSDLARIDIDQVGWREGSLLG